MQSGHFYMFKLVFAILNGDLQYIYVPTLFVWVYE